MVYSGHVRSFFQQRQPWQRDGSTSRTVRGPMRSPGQLQTAHAAMGNQALQKLLARNPVSQTEPVPATPEPKPKPEPPAKPEQPVKPAPEKPDKPAPAPGCAITTNTVDAAPDGSPKTRKTVGVNEDVAAGSSVPATWTVSCGKMAPVPASDRVIIWTAPENAGTCTLTATPVKGGPCSVSMDVLAPASRSLKAKTPRKYTRGRAGSGFEADVTIQPVNVSFGRIETREEKATGVATGYYDKTLGWNGKVHPEGAWAPVTTDNRLTDGIGTQSPGSAGPFSEGTFTWEIPQSYRILRDTGKGFPFEKAYTARHTQVMTDATGEETTSKEGADRKRTP